MNIIDILVDDSNEDTYLKSVASQSYDYAIVYRVGHEFIDKQLFVEEINKDNFFIMGHILDRELLNAYYELHTQCYIINLNTYKELGCPAIGQQSFHASHRQIQPTRSNENYHDDFTPWWVRPGHIEKQYEHKPHGWNILSIAFKHNLPVLVFNSVLRRAKKFNYELTN
jgi:hypothetical protein